MPKSLPPLAWFRTFEAAARHLSFTAAAEEIGMTQSAVSQQVKALETRLQVALFTRHARGLSLTDRGRRLLPQVGDALERLTAATEMFQGGPSENQLTVATSVSVAHWVISPHLASFTAAHPGLNIRLLSAIWPDDFVSARADVEIRFGSHKQVGRDAQLLEPSRLVALKSPDLVGDIADLPLIEAVGTSGGWNAWNRAVCETSKPTLFCDSYGMALQWAVHGHGVALVSALLAGHAVQSGLLVRAHPATLKAQEGYFLSVKEANASASAFRDWLLSLISHDPEAFARP